MYKCDLCCSWVVTYKNESKEARFLTWFGFQSLRLCFDLCYFSGLILYLVERCFYTSSTQTNPNICAN